MESLRIAFFRKERELLHRTCHGHGRAGVAGAAGAPGAASPCVHAIGSVRKDALTSAQADMRQRLS